MQRPALPRPRCQNTRVIRPPNDNGSSRTDARRQQCVQRTLLEQGVTARKQDDVQAHMLHRLEAYRSLVHTEPKGVDCTAAAQLVQRTKTTTIGQLTESRVVTIAMGQSTDVVHIQNIDSCQ